MRRQSIAVLVALAALPASAVAAPAGRAQRQHGPGVKLTWPLRGQRATVAAGAVVTVRVRALRRRSARVTVALTRAGGRRTVKRRTLRAGVFSARLPRATGVSYVLSAKAGRRLLRRTTLVVPPAARARAPLPPLPPPPAPGAPCFPRTTPNGPVSGTFSGDSRLLDYGQTLTLTFTNTSPQACLWGGLDYILERRGADGSWGPSGLSIPFPAIALTLAPGRSSSVSFTADDSWFENPAGTFQPQPGRYRIAQGWSANDGAVVSESWEFGLKLDASSRCGQPARAAAARLTAGTSVLSLLQVADDGGVCARLPASIAIERVLGDGGTEPAATVTRSPCASATAAPGGAIGYGFYGGGVAPLLEAGRYRASATATAVPLGGADQALPLALDFELTAPIGGGPTPIVDCALPPWAG